jgi:hypothetical protein
MILIKIIFQQKKTNDNFAVDLQDWWKFGKRHRELSECGCRITKSKLDIVWQWTEKNENPDDRATTGEPDWDSMSAELILIINKQK